MEKTIKERAEDFAHVYNDRDRHFAEECYVQGATDQRKIDIDKACEWLRQCTTFQYPDFRHPVPYFDEEDVESLKRAMEE